jgi:SAM-dependent methyltransferase
LFAYAAGEEPSEAAHRTGAASEPQLPVQSGEATVGQANAPKPAPPVKLLRRVILLKPNSVLIDDEVLFAGPAGEATWRVEHASAGQPQDQGKPTTIVVGQYELVCEPLGVGEEERKPTTGTPAPAIGAATSIRRLYLCEVRNLSVGGPLSAHKVNKKEHTYQLGAAVGRRLFTLVLPPLGEAAGKIAVAEEDGRQLLSERHLPAGLLPRGMVGRKLMERWDSAYRSGRPGWDTGRPSSELVRAVEEGTLKPCRVVELGCGTGTNAIFLASKGFDVTAIDVAPTALRLAEEKAQKAGVRVRWLLADVLWPPRLAPFDLVYDRGCYHGVRQQNAARYVEALAKLTKPGSQVLILAGNANEERQYGPPRVKEEEIRADFSKLFEFQWLRETRFDSADPQRPGALAWSVLLRRK